MNNIHGVGGLYFRSSERVIYCVIEVATYSWYKIYQSDCSIRVIDCSMFLKALSRGPWLPRVYICGGDHTVYTKCVNVCSYQVYLDAQQAFLHLIRSV